MGFTSGALSSPGLVRLFVSDRSSTISRRAIDQASVVCHRLGAELSVIDVADLVGEPGNVPVRVTPTLVVQRSRETRCLFGNFHDEDRVVDLLFGGTRRS